MAEHVAWGHLEPYLKAAMETMKHAVVVGHPNS